MYQGQNCLDIIADSGSDITLISHKALTKMSPSLKIRQGQRVNLVQVMGSSTISGFVTIPLFFKTNDGPVCIVVEAYVVKGMSTPFILGNDFADQYQLSLLCGEDGTHLQFGNTGQQILVEGIEGSPLKDKEGHVFQVFTKKEQAGHLGRIHTHRRAKIQR